MLWPDACAALGAQRCPMLPGEAAHAYGTLCQSSCLCGFGMNARENLASLLLSVLRH